MEKFILDNGEVVDDKYVYDNLPDIIYTLSNIKYNKITHFVKGKFHEYIFSFYTCENDKFDIYYFRENVILGFTKKIFYAEKIKLHKKIMLSATFKTDDIFTFLANCKNCNLPYIIIYFGIDNSGNFNFIEPLKKEVFNIPFDINMINMGNTPCNEIMIKNILE